MDQNIRSRPKSGQFQCPATEKTPLLQHWADSELSAENNTHFDSYESNNVFLDSSSSVNHKVSVGMSNLLSQKYESLDYDICESTLFVEEQAKRSKRIQTEKQWKTCFKFLNPFAKVQVLRWVVICMIGILVGLIAFIITISIDTVSHLKFSFIKKNIEKCMNYDCLISAYLYWMLFCGISVLIGSSLVAYVAPVAAGSGIPVIKCYLNGVKVPEVVRLKTLLVKAVGVVSSVVGGLACGKEGPMIHCGAVIAAGISQGKSTSLKRNCKIFEEFREDHEKRDFVSAGAAAGVAAAFGAPVGGVLFSLEEGASFWNQSLTVRIFFCSLVSYFTINFALSSYHGETGVLSFPGLINFGKFENLNYNILELPLYAMMGAVGGLFGAFYNHVNYSITVFRIRYIKHSLAKIFEAVMVSIVFVTFSFMTTFINSCLPNENSNIEFPVGMNCDIGQYRTFWSVWLQTPEGLLRSLLHDPEYVWDALWMLLPFFIIYSCFGCWTYGLCISSGLFVPTLIIGAAWGRLLGTGMISLLSYFNLDVSMFCYSKFAIVGAAAMLGGVTRMTISLTVILMEAIGNITFGLPIMVTVMAAKWIGDLFNEGLYDIHIQLSSVPFLDWEPPPYSYTIYASEVMSYPVVCVRSVEKIGFIENMLKTESHNGFPVVDVTEDSYDNVHTFGTYRGMILRWQLIVLLQHKVFNETAEQTWQDQKLSLKDFRDSYPRHPTIQQIHISPAERNFTIDLQPFLNPSAYTISHRASLPRIFKLFRALGLRHLPVVDDKNCVVGIVTRKDIGRFRARKHGEFGIEELQVSYG